MSVTPPFAPGCFGSALAYAPSQSVCAGCVFAEQCKPVHEANLAALQQHFNIVRPVGAAKPVKQPKAVAPSSDPAVLGLPVKVQQLVDKLDRGNFRVIENMLNGINPFANGMPFMRMACHLLMGLAPHNMALSREQLSAQMATRLNWQPGTADAHARMAIQALVHIGAVDQTDAGIKLRSAS